MPNRYAVGHRDTNEPEIIEMIDEFHVPYRKGHEGDGYDLLLLTCPMMFVEVKNPKQAPSKRKLTAAECETLAHCADVGIPYHVVMTAEEMADILAVHFRQPCSLGAEET